jgi:predicted DNA-binding transcriptional regulator AlpA
LPIFTARVKNAGMSTQIDTPVVSLTAFAKALGISRTTAWRFRNRGLIRTCNISGRVYVFRESIAEFFERASRGDLASNAATAKPSRNLS